MDVNVFEQIDLETVESTNLKTYVKKKILSKK